jgi:hypothetical protein
MTMMIVPRIAVLRRWTINFGNWRMCSFIDRAGTVAFSALYSSEISRPLIALRAMRISWTTES